jgi:hypothetical protein
MLISTRPPVSLAIRSAAAWARMLSGCVSGRLLPYFNENSAARAMRGMAPTKPAAGITDKACRARRRVSWIMVSSGIF